MSSATAANAETPNPILALRRYPFLVLAAALVFASAGWFYASFRPPVYASTVGLVVEDARSAGQPSSRAERYAADQVRILASTLIAERASEIAAANDPPEAIPVEEFLARTSIKSTSESNYISATFTAEDPVRSRVGANAIGSAYEEVIEATLAEDAARAISELDEVIEATAQEITDLQRAIDSSATAASALRRQQDDAITRSSELTLRRSQIEVDARLAGNGLAFFAPANLGKPRGFPASTAIVLLGAVGALLGAGLAYYLTQQHQTVESRMQPRPILGVPLLADIPSLTTSWIFTTPFQRKRLRQAGKSAGTLAQLLPVIDDPGSDRAEPFRLIAGALAWRLGKERVASPSGAASQSPTLLIRAGGAPSRGAANGGGAPLNRGLIIAVCASQVDEGQTAVAANTAIAAGRAGLKVILVDGDPVTQDATRLMQPITRKLSQNGLTDVMYHDVALRDAITPLQAGPGSSVHLLKRGNAGEPDVDLFGTPAATRVLEELALLYDLVIIDLPPLLDTPYTGSALRQADRALVVVRHRSRLDDLLELKHRLDVLGVESVGYVYTDSPLRIGSKRSERLSQPDLGDVAQSA